ncbi:hypothetical protein CEXT_80601 [Caerostris extrusa]|uniref:Ig-like domain-containing protein n=1 Tax=Caerostris extrusa TaxID=172846 RepID=A0AAV4TJ14_CAEEX|nr:hypothetical protein CEXT_80601 [Caerostris extrusa]
MLRFSSTAPRVEKSTQSGTTSELLIRTEASDNGATYRCEARNSALKKPLTAAVELSVLCCCEKDSSSKMKRKSHLGVCQLALPLQRERSPSVKLRDRGSAEEDLWLSGAN